MHHVGQNFSMHYVRYKFLNALLVQFSQDIMLVQISQCITVNPIFSVHYVGTNFTFQPGCFDFNTIRAFKFNFIHLNCTINLYKCKYLMQHSCIILRCCYNTDLFIHTVQLHNTFRAIHIPHVHHL